jgi:sterol desaturase/sphingolipid hydroxylase (fatty acid hydroxylase superfamily)
MRLNPIALAIPVFLLAMGLELLVARARRRTVYRFQDAIADLGCGVAQQVAGVFIGAALLAAYQRVFQGAALLHLPEGSGWAWLIAFVGVDVAYYWWHRASHEVNVLWAVHAVHHQSEDYNLAVALRQAILSTTTSFPFYLPLAFLGVPTLVFATTLAFSTLYQFWIHTELIQRLGPLERVLNTPSAHRVHHAVNPRYLDRNYAAVLIVWDRLFGTYAPERERPVYGVTKPLRSFNPVWAQLQPWWELWEKSRRLTGLDRLRVWWKSPAWSPTGAPLPTEAEVQERPKFERPVAAGLRRYAFAQFLPLIAATFFMLLSDQATPPGPLVVAALLVFWTLLTVGGLLDGRRWAVPLEVARLTALAALLVAWTPLPASAGRLALAPVPLALGLVAWLLLEARRRAGVAPGATPGAEPAPPGGFVGPPARRSAARP